MPNPRKLTTKQIFAVSCPVCWALAEQPCVWEEKRLYVGTKPVRRKGDVHPARLAAARKWVLEQKEARTMPKLHRKAPKKLPDVLQEFSGKVSPLDPRKLHPNAPKELPHIFKQFSGKGRKPEEPA